jgi:hypothetical protein
MDRHGDFRRTNPMWDAQSRLIEKLSDFCENQFGNAPDSSLREQLPGWLTEWRRRKVLALSKKGKKSATR